MLHKKLLLVALLGLVSAIQARPHTHGKPVDHPTPPVQPNEANAAPSVASQQTDDQNDPNKVLHAIWLAKANQRPVPFDDPPVAQHPPSDDDGSLTGRVDDVNEEVDTPEFMNEDEPRFNRDEKHGDVMPDCANIMNPPPGCALDERLVEERRRVETEKARLRREEEAKLIGENDPKMLVGNHIPRPDLEAESKPVIPPPIAAKNPGTPPINLKNKGSWNDFEQPTAAPTVAKPLPRFRSVHTLRTELNANKEVFSKTAFATHGASHVGDTTASGAPAAPAGPNTAQAVATQSSASGLRVNWGVVLFGTLGVLLL